MAQIPDVLVRLDTADAETMCELIQKLNTLSNLLDEAVARMTELGEIVQRLSDALEGC